VWSVSGLHPNAISATASFTCLVYDIDVRLRRPDGCMDGCPGAREVVGCVIREMGEMGVLTVPVLTGEMGVWGFS
jgi:hypothetical protein